MTPLRSSRGVVRPPALLLILALIALSTFAGAGPGGAPAGAALAATLGRLPLAFVENRGQASPEVRYFVTGRDKSISFGDSGLKLHLTPAPPATNAGGVDEKEPREQLGGRNWTVALDFLGGARRQPPVAEEDAGTTFSYFRGAGRTGSPACAGTTGSSTATYGRGSTSFTTARPST